MDIPLVSSLPLAGVAGATAIAPRQAPSAIDAVSVAPLAPSLTTVDLSPLGRFLSATSLFQKKMVEQQVSVSSVPDSQASTFGEVAAATTAFGVAFNELQASSLAGANADTGAGGESLAGLFARQFGAETTAVGGDQDSALASLASIGVRFNTDPTVDPDARLTFDLPLLQVALEVDPATTTALLARAGAAFGTLVQAEVQAADLSAGAAPSAPTDLPDLNAEPLPGQPFQQETLAANARVATAARDELGVVAAPATAASPAASPAVAGADAVSDLSPAPAQPNPVALEARAPAPGAPAGRAVPASGQVAATVAANDPVSGSSVDTQAAPPVLTAPAILPDVRAEVPALAAGSAPAPVPIAIPATPPATAALPGTPEADMEVARQSAATPVTRPAAENELADRAFELAENKRSQSAYEQERTELADRIELLDRQKLLQQEVDARADALQRQRAGAASRPLAALPAVTVAAVPTDAVQPDPTLAPEARPLAPPVNSAQPSSRDPAVAAAIAAYSLSTSPFAALNARQEAAAQRVKTVPAVSNVAPVAAIETQTAPKGGTRQ